MNPNETDKLPAEPTELQNTGFSSPAIAIFLFGVFVVSYIAWSIYHRIQAPFRFQPDPPFAELSFTEEQSEITNAVDGTWRVGPEEYPELRKLLQQLVATSPKPEKRQEFESLVDWPAYLSRFYTTCTIPFKSEYEWQSVVKYARERLTLPFGEAFQIAKVIERSPEAWVAYTYSKVGEATDIPYAFLFKKSGNAWKLVDWHEITSGNWVSHQEGVELSIWFDPYLSSNEARLQDILQDAVTLCEKGQRQEAISKLRVAQTVKGAADLRLRNFHSICYGFLHLDEIDEAKHALEIAGAPQNYPWLLIDFAYVASKHEDPTEVLKWCIKYEDYSGFYLPISQHKLLAYEKLGQIRNAELEATRILKYSPDDPEALNFRARSPGSGD